MYSAVYSAGDSAGDWTGDRAGDWTEDWTEARRVAPTHSCPVSHGEDKDDKRYDVPAHLKALFGPFDDRLETVREEKARLCWPLCSRDLGGVLRGCHHDR